MLISTDKFNKYKFNHKVNTPKMNTKAPILQPIILSEGVLQTNNH